MNVKTLPESNQCAGVAGPHLTFALGREFYGNPVLKARELIQLPSIARVPQMAGCIRVVANRV